MYKGWGVDAKSFQIFEIKIYSKGLKLSVAVHSYVSEIWMSNVCLSFLMLPTATTNFL